MFGILLAALLVRPLSRQHWISLPVVLIVLGFISSEIWVGLGRDTGLRWNILRDLVFYLLLPILIFEAALNVNVSNLKKNGLIIIALAVPLLLAAAWIAAMLIINLMGPALGGSLLLALMIGTMICATDPAISSSILKAAGAPEQIISILEGESLFNDATTITLFVLLSTLIITPEMMVSTSYMFGRFAWVFLGGLVTGFLLGRIFDFFIRPLDDTVATTAATLVLAFSSFWLAEQILGVSGVVTTLAAGLTIAWCERRHRSDEDIRFARHSWRMLSFCADAMLFFLVGMSITINMFQQNWLAMLTGILAAFVSRTAIVFMGAGLLSRLPGQQPISLAGQNLMVWGGIRGGVAIALALSLDINIPHWYVIQSTVYGVALFSLLVQPPVLASITRSHR